MLVELCSILTENGFAAVDAVGSINGFSASRDIKAKNVKAYRRNVLKLHTHTASSIQRAAGHGMHCLYHSVAEQYMYILLCRQWLQCE